MIAESLNIQVDRITINRLWVVGEHVCVEIVIDPKDATQFNAIIVILNNQSSYQQILINKLKVLFSYIFQISINNPDTGSPPETCRKTSGTAKFLDDGLTIEITLANELKSKIKICMIEN